MPRRMTRSDNPLMTADRFEPAGYPNGQAFVSELVDDVEQAKFASLIGAFLEEVVGPDVVGTLGPQPNARSDQYPGFLRLSALFPQTVHESVYQISAMPRPFSGPKVAIRGSYSHLKSEPN